MKNRTFKQLAEFERRRKDLCEGNARSAIVLFSGPEPKWERFRAHSDFVYLTGFEEPDSICVLLPGNKKPFHMFVRPRDPNKEIWDGFRYGLGGVKEIFGADMSYDTNDFAKEFPKLLRDIDKVHYSLNGSEDDFLVLRSMRTYVQTLGRTGRGLLPIYDPTDILGEMRIKKSKQEVDWIREACELSADAHVQAMKTVRPGMNEKDVQAMLFQGFFSRGAHREGYFSIVASGANATILHYRDNNDACKEGDLLLIDAGAEKNYYTADITRTFPVNGKYSPAQKDVYGRVLKVQKKLIEHIKPGVTYESLQEQAKVLLTEELIDIGFLKGTVKENVDSGAYKKYYPHNIGHFLGMDVHDVGLYKIDGQSRCLEEGMVLTVEPGLYIPEDDETVPAEYRGIGVRIEDDIYVSSTGREVLTSSVPKEISEIEALMS